MNIKNEASPVKLRGFFKRNTERPFSSRGLKAAVSRPRMYNLPKQTAVIFFLFLLQQINSSFLSGIDFLFLGLLLTGYFLNFYKSLVFSLSILILLFSLNRGFSITVSLSYLFLPAMAIRLSSFFSLNYLRYSLICVLLLIVYITTLLLALHSFSLKNFFILTGKNLTAGIFLYFLLKPGLFSKTRPEIN